MLNLSLNPPLCADQDTSCGTVLPIFRVDHPTLTQSRGTSADKPRGKNIVYSSSEPSLGVYRSFQSDNITNDNHSKNSSEDVKDIVKPFT